MLFAIDENSNKINAVDGNKQTIYTCPCCSQEVVLKQGNVNIHHFAHKTNKDCDSWYEMTQWHITHQNVFKDVHREVVLSDGIEKHRADVLVEHKGKTLIIEFQNSPISKEEIMKRSKFYSQFGELLWVFNFSDKWIRKTRETKHLQYFCWDWAVRSLPTLKELAALNVDICFELESGYVFPYVLENGYSVFKVRKKDIVAHDDFLNKLRDDFFVKGNDRIQVRLDGMTDKEYANKKRNQKQEEHKKELSELLKKTIRDNMIVDSDVENIISIIKEEHQDFHYEVSGYSYKKKIRIYNKEKEEIRKKEVIADEEVRRRRNEEIQEDIRKRRLAQEEEKRRKEQELQRKKEQEQIAGLVRKVNDKKEGIPLKIPCENEKQTQMFELTLKEMGVNYTVTDGFYGDGIVIVCH